MKRGKALNALVKIIAVAALGLAGGHFISGRVRAVPPGPTESVAFGPVGIVAGQTARLNVSSLTLAPPTDPTAVELTFFDVSGAVLEQQVVELSPSQSAFLDLAIAAGTPGAVPGRIEIRPFARIIPAGPNEVGSSSPIRIIATTEVFDSATGKASILYPHSPCFAGDCFGRHD